MGLEHTVPGVVPVAAPAGVTGCGSPAEPSGDAAGTSSPAAASASQPPAAAGPETTAESAPAEAEGQVLFTIRDVEDELPDSVAPGAMVTGHLLLTRIRRHTTGSRRPAGTSTQAGLRASTRRSTGKRLSG